MARKGLRKAYETSSSTGSWKNPKKRKLDEQEDEEEQEDDDEEEEEEEDLDFRIAVGLDTNDAADLSDVLQLASENDLHFACVPLFHPRLRSKSSSASSSSALITRSDMALDHTDWVITSNTHSSI